MDRSTLSVLSLEQISQYVKGTKPILSAQMNVPEQDFRTLEQQSTIFDSQGKKKRRKKKKTVDPLRPTKRISFGVDIGQGINTINYLKENTTPLTKYRKTKLHQIFVNPIPPYMTEKSLDEFYKVGPLGENSETKLAAVSGSTAKIIKKVNSSTFYNSSERDIYRIVYKYDYGELPHDYGIDYLQSLFVPNRLDD